MAADSLAAEARMAGMLPRGPASGLTLTPQPPGCADANPFEASGVDHFPAFPASFAQSPTIDTLSKMRPSPVDWSQPPSRAPPYGSKPRWAAADVPSLGADAFTSPAKAAAAPAPASPAARSVARALSFSHLPHFGGTALGISVANAAAAGWPVSASAATLPVRRSAAVGAAISAAGDDDAGAASARRSTCHAAVQTEEAAPPESAAEPSEPPPPPGTPPTPDGHVADAEDDDYADDDFDDDDDDDAATAPPAPATAAPPPQSPPPPQLRRSPSAPAAFAFGGGATARLANEYIAAAQPASPEAGAKRRAEAVEWARRAIESPSSAPFAQYLRALRASERLRKQYPFGHADARRARLDALGVSPPRRFHPGMRDYFAPAAAATAPFADRGIPRPAAPAFADGPVCWVPCRLVPCGPPSYAGPPSSSSEPGWPAWTTASMGGPVRFQM